MGLRNYAIFIVAAVIVVAATLIESLPSVFPIDFGPTPGPKDPSVLWLWAVIIPTIIFGIAASIVGIRTYSMYGGEIGNALMWIVAGVLLSAGIMVTELPPHTGLVQFRLLQHFVNHSMATLGAIFSLVGLIKLGRVLKAGK